MAESVQLAVQPRDGFGSRAVKRLRKQGLLPAVVYGHKEATVTLALSQDDFAKALRLGARLVELKTDRSAQAAIIQEVQWDHLGKDVLHVDFKRVSADERITVPVRIEVRGIAPGVSGGGVLDQPLHVINVECLVTAVPDEIRVPVGELQLGQAIYVKDLRLPEGVKAMADAEAIVVQITAPQAEPTAAAVAPVAETAEPEVIGRQAKAEEGEEEK